MSLWVRPCCPKIVFTVWHFCYVQRPQLCARWLCLLYSSLANKYQLLDSQFEWLLTTCYFEPLSNQTKQFSQWIHSICIHWYNSPNIILGLYVVDGRRLNKSPLFRLYFFTQAACSLSNSSSQFRERGIQFGELVVCSRPAWQLSFVY